jgi:hypothetical protein
LKQFARLRLEDAGVLALVVSNATVSRGTRELYRWFHAIFGYGFGNGKQFSSRRKRGGVVEER